MLPGSFLNLICALFPALALTSCIPGAPEFKGPAIEWNSVATPLGSLNVALVRPADEGTQNHPVILALPWGSGSDELVESFVGRYWLTEPAARGYYVVSPEVYGPSLEADATELIPAVFAWMESELTIDASQVVIVGASNGGRGLFFAALSRPDRFKALLGLPGMYQGDPSQLGGLVGKPIRLIVGEFDAAWLSGTEETAAALESQGINPEVHVAESQGHVLSLDPKELLDWIDAALGR